MALRYLLSYLTLRVMSQRDHNSACRFWEICMHVVSDSRVTDETHPSRNLACCYCSLVSAGATSQDATTDHATISRIGTCWCPECASRRVGFRSMI